MAQHPSVLPPVRCSHPSRATSLGDRYCIVIPAGDLVQRLALFFGKRIRPVSDTHNHCSCSLGPTLAKVSRCPIASRPILKVTRPSESAEGKPSAIGKWWIYLADDCEIVKHSRRSWKPSCAVSRLSRNIRDSRRSIARPQRLACGARLASMGVHVRPSLAPRQPSARHQVSSHGGIPRRAGHAIPAVR